MEKFRAELALFSVLKVRALHDNRQWLQANQQAGILTVILKSGLV